MKVHTPSSTPQRFLAAFDLHFGYERRGGHKIPLHDERALSCFLKVAESFQPHRVILGGDIIDCGEISHHNHGKPGRTQGIRLLDDVTECSERFIYPLQRLCTPTTTFDYLIGNHEHWLTDMEDEIPGLEGMLDVRRLLGLGSMWTVHPQGCQLDWGKLTFIHGDQLSSGEHCAKHAVTLYERSIRFGHLHTHQVYAKNTPNSHKLAKTGMAVGCLCRKDPSYGKGKPNRWVQGFVYGYVWPNGDFFDAHATILNGRTVVNGQVFQG